MKYFKRLHANIETKTLLQEIDENEDVWMENTSRQEVIKVQRETNTIFLKSQVRRPDIHANENQLSGFTKISSRFPYAVLFLTAFAESMNAELS